MTLPLMHVSMGGIMTDLQLYMQVNRPALVAYTISACMDLFAWKGGQATPAFRWQAT